MCASAAPGRIAAAIDGLTVTVGTPARRAGSASVAAS